MYHVALVADMNGAAAARVSSTYTSGTPTVFMDGGHGVMVGGFDGVGLGLVPYYTPLIEAAGARTVPAIDLVTAIEWLGNNTVRVHVAVGNGVDANTVPTVPVTPTGPVSFFSGEVKTFYTEATDPDGNALHYRWDWGDGQVSDWIGPFDEGTQAMATHSWDVDGDYDVMVQTRDPFGLETVWSTSLAVAANCCQGRVGDANSSMDEEPTIGDISVLIDAKFIAGTCDGILNCLIEADINQSGGLNPTCADVTIGDISFLIDYLFITGPGLGLPDCL